MIRVGSAATSSEAAVNVVAPISAEDPVGGLHGRAGLVSLGGLHGEPDVAVLGGVDDALDTGGVGVKGHVELYRGRRRASGGPGLPRGGHAARGAPDSGSQPFGVG